MVESALRASRTACVARRPILGRLLLLSALAALVAATAADPDPALRVVAGLRVELAY